MSLEALEDLKIPDEILLLCKEKERAWIQSGTTGSFEEMEAAEAEYNQIAHFIMCKAHSKLMADIKEGAKH